MHGIRRVLVFCTLITVLPTTLLVIPLYLRHSFYANVAYVVTESDILEINDGISTIFCSEQTIEMNGTFNAFQVAQRPEITSYRKHIRLKKSMNLPDDTLEYWGFYLLKSATVILSVCSRFPGASILVVKGERNLRTCSMLEHNNNKGRDTDIFLPEANKVKITFESHMDQMESEDETDQEVTLSNEEINDTENSTQNIYDIYKSHLNQNYTNTNLDGIDFVAHENDSVSLPYNKEIEMLIRTAETYVEKHIELERTKKQNLTKKLRHAKRRFHRIQIEKQKKKEEQEKLKLRLENLLRQEENLNMEHFNPVSYTPDYSETQQDLVKSLESKLNLENENNENNYKDKELKIAEKDEVRIIRKKRNQEYMEPPQLLDQGIKHGGNADKNINDSNDASSVSSFENDLLNCYEGAILLTQEFEPSDKCINVDYLVNGTHMEARHDVVEDGYYYYIFYSDNDFVSNDIHALFDIYKPTFQYENVTKSCINETKCSFSLPLLSSDRVIVEISTKDGIDHEKNDVNLLISICHPRMGVYIIFPIAVLLFILGCAFM